jgi:hypothetical protein
VTSPFPKIVLDRVPESLARVPGLTPITRDRGPSLVPTLVPANIRAVGAIYFSAKLEEMKLFAVAEVVTQHFVTGSIALPPGPSADALHASFKDSARRPSEAERRELYARVIGLYPGAASGFVPNAAFVPALGAFAQAIHAFSASPAAIANVGPAGRALGENATTHGYGAAHFMAIELHDRVQAISTMLSGQDVLAAYGVRDLFQLIERVSALHLGGSENTVQKRSLATSGAAILGWVASNLPALVDGDASKLRAAILGSGLVNDVERWLIHAASSPIIRVRRPL